MQTHVLHLGTDPAAFLAQEFAYDGPTVEETTEDGEPVQCFTITTRHGTYAAEMFEMPVTMPHEVTE
jgi:hypothetical protein